MLVVIELAVCVALRQRLFQLYYASALESLSQPGVAPLETLFAVPNDEFRAKLWLVSWQVLLSRQP